MNVLSALLNTHLAVAVLLLVVGLVFSWNRVGRRVVSAVAVLQLVLGLALAGLLGRAAPPGVWAHLAIAIVILGANGMSLAYSKRAGGERMATILSVIALLFIAYNIYFGWQLAGHA